jgi:hypothetical protein
LRTLEAMAMAARSCLHLSMSSRQIIRATYAPLAQTIISAVTTTRYCDDRTSPDIALPLHRDPNMSRNDSLKEEIGWLKVMFALLAAIEASLIAWLAQNYISANLAILLLASAATIVTGAMIALINFVAFRHFRSLENN